MMKIKESLEKILELNKTLKCAVASNPILKISYNIFEVENREKYRKICNEIEDICYNLISKLK